MSATKTVAMNGGRPVLRTQEQALRSPATVIAIFGGWRSGKTTGAALKFLANCIANPWTPEYGEDRPYSIVIGLTRSVLRDSGYRELKRIIPKEAIARESNASDDWSLTLTNGHVIKFKTAAGAVEGASACTVWLDEADKLPDETAYLNYQMRASDALGRRFLVIVSGLPESGWLEDTFDRPEHRDSPSRLTIFCATADNHYLPPHVLAEYRSSASKTNAIKYLEGRWMPKTGAIYGEWRPSLHLVDDAGDKTQPTHLAIDPGAKGAALFLQERVRRVRVGGKIVEQLGLHVVDEWLCPREQTMLETARALKSRGWLIHPSRSMVFLDPTTRPDELAAVREVFGDIRPITKARGEPAEKVEFGIDCVKAALLDADDNVRLTVYRGLPRGDGRNLLSALTRYHRKNGKPVRDDTVDHVLDCLRYPVAHLLPVRRVDHVVTRAA